MKESVALVEKLRSARAIQKHRSLVSKAYYQKPEILMDNAMNDKVMHCTPPITENKITRLKTKLAVEKFGH